MNHKNRMRPAALLLLLMLCMLILPDTTSGQVAAAGDTTLAELEDKLAEAARQHEQAEKDVTAAQSDKADAQKQKAAIDKKILALIGEMDAISQLIEGYEINIGIKNNEIAAEEEKLNHQYGVLRERIRLNHESGGLDFISILLESDGLTDFFTQMDRYTCMLDYDKQLMQSYTEGIASLNTDKENLIARMKAQEEAKTLLEAKKTQLEADRAAADKLIADAEKDIETATANLAQIEAIEKQYNEERAAKLAALQEQSNQSYVGGIFLWPLPQKYDVVSCGFGWRIHPVTGKSQYHLGIDIPAAYGTEIYACNDGTVVEVSYNYADGYYVTIDHGGGVASFYSHLSRYRVKVGDKVTRGQVIANVGTSGYTTGAHLNLNIYENGTAVNPMTYFE
ncbi:MAG: peptidoglycan DD-metalloendopeptidase family protein [Clostridia bacterium]|nr:peptidoglycan DD-metalloendopeptidase family protein [Clostridia bacterium]